MASRAEPMRANGVDSDAAGWKRVQERRDRQASSARVRGTFRSLANCEPEATSVGPSVLLMLTGTSYEQGNGAAPNVCTSGGRGTTAEAIVCLHLPARPGRILVVFHEAVLAGASRAVLRHRPAARGTGVELRVLGAVPGRAQDELEARGYEYAGAERLLRYRGARCGRRRDLIRRLATMPGLLPEFRAFVGGTPGDPARQHPSHLS